MLTPLTPAPAPEFPYLVPQLYCKGTAPSGFRVRIAPCLYDPKRVQHISARKLSAIAVACLVAVEAFLRAAEPIRARRLVKQHAEGRLFGLDMLSIALTLLAVGGTVCVVYINVSRFIKYRFSKTQSIDADYQNYLRQLANHDVVTLAVFIERTKYKFKNDLLEETIEALLKCKYEALLQAPHHELDFIHVLALIKYARCTQKTICESIVNAKMQTPYQTHLQVYMKCWEESTREREGAAAGANGNDIDLRVANVFEGLITEEYAAIESTDVALQKNLDGVGSYLRDLLGGDVTLIILQYCDESEIAQRIERIYAYTVKTRYYDADVDEDAYQNLDVYYDFLCKIALLHVKNAVIRDFSEARLLLNCLPGPQKLKVIEAMLKLPAYCGDMREELETMQGQIQAGVQTLEDLAEKTTPRLTAIDRSLFVNARWFPKAYGGIQDVGHDAAIQAIRNGV